MPPCREFPQAASAMPFPGERRVVRHSSGKLLAGMCRAPLIIIGRD
jgi:hypothetical protein